MIDHIISANSSNINSTLSIDSDTLIVQVFLLATTQTSATFYLNLLNLVPSGQIALANLTSAFTSGLVSPFGNVNRTSNRTQSVYFSLSEKDFSLKDDDLD